MPAKRAARIVIVGVGFGGLAAARGLAKSPAEIVLVDRRNYHLFQPLLYQVATAALSPADIAWPIRALVSGQANTSVRLGRVTGIDLGQRQLLLEEERLDYDQLVLATGARHSYFGHDAWEATAPGLKKIADATHIRERILIAFERAEVCCDAAEQRRLLTFVVIGAGPTGVEMAGAIAELARMALKADFRRIDPRATRVVLVEAGPRVLPSFPERLSAAACRQLERLGVEVRTKAAVTACDEEGVELAGERLAARTVIWAAGVIASPAARWLGAAADRAGRVLVEPDLSVPGHPEIFVIGDTAACLEDGRPVPGIAPAAKQMGTYVARLLDARLRGRPAPAAFRYRHQGSLATIGRRAAVADLGWIRLAGPIAWALWALAHVWFLIGWRNRVVVGLNWLWNYVTFERGARLITAAAEEGQPQPRLAVDRPAAA
ncbi:MAG: NAD(P)/FAD-dependent oxidoreductase [Geminicoccaceae bacterium]